MDLDHPDDLLTSIPDPDEYPGMACLSLGYVVIVDIHVIFCLSVFNIMICLS